MGAIGPVLDLLPVPGQGEQAAALAEVSGLFASAGITWVQDAWVARDQVDAWLAAASCGSLRFRANLAFRAEPTAWKDQLEEFAADRDRVTGEGRGWLTARTVKFFADGVVESGTAALLEPYHDCPHSHGIANWTAEELADAVAAADAAGFQAHVHAIGDAGVRLALDAIAETTRRNGPADRRPVLAHVQLIDPADLPRFAALGVIANLEPLWAQPDPLMTELTLPRLGTARGTRQYQIASLLTSGARVSFGSDWPVTAYQPLYGIATAITRQTPAENPDGGWLPAERISAADAQAAYSAGVAYQAFEEHQWGMLRPGHARRPGPPRRRPRRHPRPRAARPARAGHLARRHPHPLTIRPPPAGRGPVLLERVGSARLASMRQRHPRRNQLRSVIPWTMRAVSGPGGSRQSVVLPPGIGSWHPQGVDNGRRTDCRVCAAVDVHYLSTGGARAAAILAADTSFSHVLAGRVAVVPRVPPCRPGEFRLRELPPLRAVATT